MDLGQFVVENDDTQAQAPRTPREVRYRSTGIDYFDKKPELTVLDAQTARGLGLDISLNANINANVKAKFMSGNKSMQDIMNTINDLDNLNEQINLVPEYARFSSGLRRKANDISGGIIPLSADGARYAALDKANVFSTARAISNGKVTNQVLNEAKDTYGSGFRGKDEMFARLAQATDAHLISLKNQINEHLGKGFEVPAEVWLELNKYEKKAEHLQKVGAGLEKFDKDYFNNLGYGEYFQHLKARNTGKQQGNEPQKRSFKRANERG